VCFLRLFLCATVSLFCVSHAGADERAESKLPIKVGTFGQEVRTFYTNDSGLPDNDVREIWIDPAGVLSIWTSKGAFRRSGDRWISADEIERPSEIARRRLQTSLDPEAMQMLGDSEIDIAEDSRGRVFVGSPLGLFAVRDRKLTPLYPEDGHKRWAPTMVHVDVDPDDRLWFSSYQGAGNFDGQQWRLYTGAEGLPYDAMTDVACTRDGTVWFGTMIGAIRFDGTSWSYRQGPRWLPDDEVRGLALLDNGDVWIATAGGLARIEFKPMTLAEKARFYEDRIDRYHRRTEFGYVIEAHGDEPGQLSNLRVETSDNDGLWTSMYGAGECFAFAATGSDDAKKRAHAAFRALQFLSQAPVGSPHEPPPGFIARTVLEVEGNADPNGGSYTLEAQRRSRLGDKKWRVYEPRWPKSADGKYYWKSDTSSDELDGHYFFYPLYYDLVCQTDAEKAAVREVVRANIDHLIAHDFSLYDHAGKTRWAVYGPQDLMFGFDYFAERGLNSISILSYLNVAYHMTGDRKYLDIAKQLRDKYAYHSNVMWPKYQRGIGSGNQSDDEMAFMAYYNLIRYEPDATLKQRYLASFAGSWQQEEPELNPFFNFCYAALALNVKYENNWGTADLSPWPGWITDSIETLKRFPLDRFNWPHRHSHRKDLLRLTRHWGEVTDDDLPRRGYRNSLKVIPVDERSFNHWNTDPWRLDEGGDGRTLGTGTVFTLPYYMGLYHGFIALD